MDGIVYTIPGGEKEMNIEKMTDEFEFVKELYRNRTLEFILNPNEERYRNTYQLLSYLLSRVYLRTPWNKICRGFVIRREDVFQHKIKAAGNMQNVKRFVDKVCNYLGLQSVEVPTIVIDELIKNEHKTLEIVRKESIYISRKAIELSSLLIKRLKEIKDNEKNKE